MFTAMSNRRTWLDAPSPTGSDLGYYDVFSYSWEFPKRMDSIFQLFSVMKQHPGSEDSQKHALSALTQPPHSQFFRLLATWRYFYSGFQGKVQKSMRSSLRADQVLRYHASPSLLHRREDSEWNLASLPGTMPEDDVGVGTLAERGRGSSI